MRNIVATARLSTSATTQIPSSGTPALERALDVAMRTEALFQNGSGFGNCPSASVHAAISGARQGFDAHIHVIAGTKGENAHAFTSLSDPSTGAVFYVSWGKVFTSVADVAEFAEIPRDAFVTGSFTVAAYIAKRIQRRVNFPPPAAQTEREYHANLITERLFSGR